MGVCIDRDNVTEGRDANIYSNQYVYVSIERADRLLERMKLTSMQLIERKNFNFLSSIVYHVRGESEI